MNTTIKIFLLCPIPDDQKPINEYIDLKENQFFNWTLFSDRFYNKKLFEVFVFSFFLISGLGFNFQIENFEKWILSNLLSSLLILLSILFIIFLRWTDIKKKFNEARIFYEESSWFDSQIWDKPFFLIKNDKLIFNQKINPILHRLKKSLIIVLLLFLLIVLIIEFL